MKKISVAMATYNGELYILDQVNSILSCLSDKDELIISDDGSNDNTCKIIRRLSDIDSRINLIEGPKKGIIKNFENAISNCHGDIIFLSDQDDVWHEDKIAKVLNAFKNAKADIVLHNANIYDSKNCKVTGTIKDVIGYRKSYIGNLIKNSFIGCCMAMTKEVLYNSMPFPDEDKIYMHDWWIGLLALKSGKKVEYIDEPLIDYRIHDNNAVGFNKNKLLKRFTIRAKLLYEINLKL